LGANTLFYDGGIGAETRSFYLRWLAEARAHLAHAFVSWRPPPEIPIARQQLSPRQHHDVLRAIGFEEILIEALHFDWRLEDWGP
jgi:hypothetical protein